MRRRCRGRDPDGGRELASRRRTRSSLIAFALWHDGRGDGFDRCTLLPLVDGFALGGTARLPASVGPAAQAAYRIEVDASWVPRRLHVRGAGDARSPEEAAVELRSAGDGRWSRDGQPAPELDGCLDVGLTFSPAALTATIRRAAIPVGEQRTLDIVTVDASATKVTRRTERFVHVAPDLYRHDPGDGERLVHLGPQGLVAEYEDAWKAVATG